jgi:hypothetical protein
MIEIPDDIRDKAIKVALDIPWQHVPTATFDQAANAIAESILAERERCALRLETISHQGMNESWWRRKFQVAADVIRNGK